MVHLFKCGNFHSKPEMPFHQRLSLPPKSVLSVNQHLTVFVAFWQKSRPEAGFRIYSRQSDERAIV